MDIMLYIIAGLVIIAVIGVLFMRKNKAQQPVQTPVTTDKAPKPSVQSASAAATTTKFDNLTIAQRFMDQQRYDKAIEAIERGLMEKPHDSALSLKMLHIYAITNQHDKFYSTYDAISMHGDAATIKEAQHLKSLLDQEQADKISVAAAQQSSADKTDIESISFDLPSTQQDAPTTPPNTSVNTSDEIPAVPSTTDDQVADSDTSAARHPIDSDDGFDLTLEDLDASDDLDIKDDHARADSSAPVDSMAPSATPAADSTLESDFVFDEDLEPQTQTASSDSFCFEDDLIAETDATANTSQEHNTDNLDDDFELDFDINDKTLDDNALSPSADSVSTTENDFVLDLEDLAFDAADLDASADNHQPAVDDTSDSQDALQLDALTLDEDTDSDITSAESEQPTIDEPSNDDFTLDISDDLSIDDDLGIDNSLNIDDNLGIDNNLSIDDSFDTDNISVNAPVAPDNTSDQAQTTSDSNQPVDFAAQFAADFDFVKSLDPQQVTLDLASEYLELGEYESARRLLTEVVHEGSNEQQQQAKALLSRTA